MTFFCTNFKRITGLHCCYVAYTFIHFNEIIANTYIIFLNFSFTLSQYLSCSHQKPYRKLHRFIVQFGLQLLGVSHFSDCFHEVFLNYKIMIGTNCKHTCRNKTKCCLLYVKCRSTSKKTKLGTVAHTYNLSTQQTATGGLQVQDQPRQYVKT